LAERDPDGFLPQLAVLWYPLALRLGADRAERAAARRAAKEASEARQRAAPILEALDRLAAAQAATDAQSNCHRPPVTRPSRGVPTAVAIRPRALGRAAAGARERLGRPFEAAYAHFRQAEALLAERALRSQVEDALRPAYHTAVVLEAKPLRLEIEGSRWLPEAEPTGRSARHCSSPKRPRAYVSRILAKLGVARRGEAAAVAHRLGLDKQ
jgi:hypothetical protein